MKILFLLPKATIHGGNLIIIGHAKALQRRGHDVSIYQTASTRGASNLILSEHIGVRICGSKEVKTSIYDLVIAGHYSTPYFAADIRSHGYIYFVQSLEQRFNNSPVDQKLALNTYYRGPRIITISEWIKDHLQELYKVKNVNGVCKNGLDKIFQSLSSQRDWKLKQDKKEYNILVENPLDFDLAKDSKTTDSIVKLLKQSREYTFKTTLITTTNKNRAVSTLWERDSQFDRILYSQSRLEMVNELEKADILIKASRIEGVPGTQLEMMSTGGIVVTSNVKGIEQYARDEFNCLMFSFGDRMGAVNQVMKVVKNHTLCQEISNNAISTAKNHPSSEDSGEMFANIVENNNWDWIPEDRKFIKEAGSRFFKL